MIAYLQLLVRVNSLGVDYITNQIGEIRTTQNTNRPLTASSMSRREG